MNQQGNLFPTEDSSDKNYEYKRAVRQAKKEQSGRVKDLIIMFPAMYSDKQFLVSRDRNGTWYCQAHIARDCIHIQRLKRLLRLKTEAGYEMSDKDWLKEVLVIGELK